MIAHDGDGLVFVEVKRSSDFDRAYASAEEYLGQMPNGSLTDVRFDVALVNSLGEVRIIENAFGHGWPIAPKGKLRHLLGNSI